MADVRIVEGPAMIKSENGRLLNYVTLNVRGRDIVGFVDEAQRVVAQKVKLPEGVHIEWSGEFEHQVRAARTLRFVFPAVIVLIFVILYLTYNDLADAALMMLAVPEALAGGAFFMYLFPKIMQGWDAPPMDFSVAVWVGFIACFGMATETGIIMLVYLREAIEKRGGLENIQSLEELRQAVIEGAVHRLRPKLLTEGVAIIAIFPMVFAKGVGGEILAPMALPVLGGLLISDEVVDLFLPVRFYWVRRALAEAAGATTASSVRGQPKVCKRTESTCGYLIGTALFSMYSSTADAARGAAADVVEGFGVFDAVFLAQLAAAGEDELLDVVAVGGHVVVAEERQLLAAAGQLGPQLRAVRAGRAFRAVGAIGVDHLIDDAADIDDAGDLGPAGVVVLVLHRCAARPAANCSG